MTGTAAQSHVVRIDSELIPDAVKRAAGILEQAGWTTRLAGGAVRDLLLGEAPHDWDLATAARPDDVGRLFDVAHDVGAAFGTTQVVVGELPMQVTTFRKETGYSDRRHPDHVVYADSPEEDARRRDFTVNALFADPADGRVLDLTGGLEDLEHGRIRAVGDPSDRMAEDALRVLRGVRFCAQLGFVMDPATAQAVRAEAGSLAMVSTERVFEELSRILTGPRPLEGIAQAEALGVLAVVLPEASAMRGVGQDAGFHPEGGVGAHTLMTLGQLPPNPSLRLAWAALLHDIGKPPTRFETDRARFHGHEVVGVEMAAGVMDRMRAPRRLAKDVSWLIEKHLWIARLPEMRVGKRRAFLLRDDADDLLALYRADSMASHGLIGVLDFAAEERAAMAEQHVPDTHLLSGRDVIDAGMAPGPPVGEVLAEARLLELEGTWRDREAALRWLSEKVADQVGE